MSLILSWAKKRMEKQLGIVLNILLLLLVGFLSYEGFQSCALATEKGPIKIYK